MHDERVVKREKIRNAAYHFIGKKGWVDSKDVSKLTGLKVVSA